MGAGNFHHQPAHERGMRKTTANNGRDDTAGRRATRPGIQVPCIAVAASAFVRALRDRYRRRTLRHASVRRMLGQTGRTTTLVHRHYGFLASLCPQIGVTVVASRPAATAGSALSHRGRSEGLGGAADPAPGRSRQAAARGGGIVAGIDADAGSAAGRPTIPRAAAFSARPARSGTRRYRTTPAASASPATGIARAGALSLRALRSRLSRNEEPALAQASGMVRPTRSTPGTAEMQPGNAGSRNVIQHPAGAIQATGSGHPLPPADLRRVTQDVMHQIDRRLHAWRERTGRI
jgi:hypothetical protein